MISHNTNSLRKPRMRLFVRFVALGWSEIKTAGGYRSPVAWHIAKRGSSFRLSALLNQTVFLE